jgi:hypothetical protein
LRVRPLVILPLLLAATALGCQKSPRDRLQGKWVGEGISAVHPSQAARADGWAKGTRLEFSGNTVTVAIPAEAPRSGTYKIAKAEGNDLDVVFSREGGSADRSRLNLTEDGKLRWILNSGVEILLHRE